MVLWHELFLSRVWVEDDDLRMVSGELADDLLLERFLKIFIFQMFLQKYSKYQLNRFTKLRTNLSPDSLKQCLH